MEEKIKKAAEAYHNRVAEANENVEAYNFSGAFIAGAEFALNNLWTSVEEGLPEDNKKVFIKYEHGIAEVGYCKRDYGGTIKWYLSRNGDYIVLVSHWMEIPD